ncbi:MAG TPA: hypothetical protein VFH75_05200 [Actinomycetota bacterium]|nr:hypothetical protein [Actinomycetota bacterium]
MRIGRIRRSRIGRLRLAGALVLGLLVATAVNALVASNTVPGTAAGSGAGTISGYTVSNIAYTLNGTNRKHRRCNVHAECPGHHGKGKAGLEQQHLLLVHEHASKRLELRDDVPTGDRLGGE